MSLLLGRRVESVLLIPPPSKQHKVVREIRRWTLMENMRIARRKADRANLKFYKFNTTWFSRCDIYILYVLTAPNRKLAVM